MLCFVFPGQGSQRPAMGAAFVGAASWELVEQASEAAGRDVAHLLVDADADELVETRNAQLATFVHSMVVSDALRRRDIEPAAVAGHSVGELSALCAAGVVTFEDGVRLVVERGEAMQTCTAGRAGTMAAVLGLDDDATNRVCAEVDGDVWVANSNAPGQVVVAGDPAAVGEAGDRARAAGAKRVVAIDVSGAFHTPFMAPALDRLGEALSSTDFHDAGLPVVANVDAEVHTDGQQWPDLLRRQLVNPVRWSASMQTLLGLGAGTFVEAGPGAVLTGTVKRIARGAARHSVATPADVDAGAAAMGGGTP